MFRDLCQSRPDPNTVQGGLLMRLRGLVVSSLSPFSLLGDELTFASQHRQSRGHVIHGGEGGQQVLQ